VRLGVADCPAVVLRRFPTLAAASFVAPPNSELVPPPRADKQIPFEQIGLQRDEYRPEQKLEVEDDMPATPDFLQHGDYILLWRDEFDGPVGTPPNPDKWAPRLLGPRCDAINVEEVARLDGQGHLLITTTRHESATSQPAATQRAEPEYHTGMISTAGKFEPTFGYFECRYRTQAQPGPVCLTQPLTLEPPLSPICAHSSLSCS